MARGRSVKKVFKKAASPLAKLAGSQDVSTSGYMVLVTYLLRWTASIYRLVWIDMLIWFVLYYTLNLVYRFALSAMQQEVFENLVEQVGEWSNKIPVTFLLGFFVSNVVSRWWNIFVHIPRMTGPANTLVAGIRGEGAAHYRSEIGRYLNLAWALAFWDFCGSLRERFDAVQEAVEEAEGELVIQDDGSVAADATRPLDEFGRLCRHCSLLPADTAAGRMRKLALLNSDPSVRRHCGRLVTRSELGVFLRRARDTKRQPEWHLPIHWAMAMANRALADGCISDTAVLLTVQAEIQNWSANIRRLINFARRQLPMVYTQVVIIAVYTIYLSDVLSRQLLHPDLALMRRSRGYYADYLLPLLGIVHVVFLLGWFKVALVLMDPFGTDEEDFPFSATFANNLKVAQLQCSSAASLYPERMLDEDAAASGQASNSCSGPEAEHLQVSESATGLNKFGSEDTN